MELTKELKDKLKNAEKSNMSKEKMDKAGMKLADEQLEQVSGGCDVNDEVLRDQCSGNSSVIVLGQIPQDGTGSIDNSTGINESDKRFVINATDGIYDVLDSTGKVTSHMIQWNQVYILSILPLLL